MILLVSMETPRDIAGLHGIGNTTCWSLECLEESTKSVWMSLNICRHCQLKENYTVGRVGIKIAPHNFIWISKMDKLMSGNANKDRRKKVIWPQGKISVLQSYDQGIWFVNFQVNMINSDETALAVTPNSWNFK